MKRTALLSIPILVALTANDAVAQQACSSIKKLDNTGAVTGTAAGPVVYVTGSSALKPLLAALGRVTFGDPTSPITVVYRSQGSCLGVDAIVNGTPMATDAVTKASYWDPNSKQIADATHTANEESCVLDMGTLADIGASDVFAQTCKFALQGLPSTLSDFQGPIQSMTFAVPQNSSESTINWQAAYLTFSAAKVSPWLDQTAFAIRNGSSGTEAMIATAIGVPPVAWLGVNGGSSDGVYAALTAPVAQADIDKTIGILASDYSSKPGVKQLFYQHRGQSCGYRPDINPLDKLNTREGRYAIWGPIHLLSQIDGSGFAKNAQARKIIAYLTGSTPPPQGVDLIRLESTAHVVPPCAMKVQRQTEMGPMTPAKPPIKCGCAYDDAATGNSGCTKCTPGGSECKATETCSYGFCETN